MKRKTVGLYDPYLDSMGGGERHVLSMLEVLEKEAGYHSTIFWDEDLTAVIKKRLNLKFDHLSFKSNIFKHGGTLKKITSLKDLEIFIYVTDGSYFFSTAKKNYIFCMVPKENLFTPSLLNSLKTSNYSYICNSGFTQKWLERFGVKASVLYPYIADEFMTLPLHPSSKEKIILVVGRFFSHLHSKRQDMAIKAFLDLKRQPQFADYKLILAGSVLDSDLSYVETLRNLAAKHPAIEIKTNIPFDQILDLYKRARFYWHFTGFGINDEIEPERVEHFGITPLEAMAAGCITLCYNAGGPKDFIHNGKNGYLFNSIEELIDQCKQIIENTDTMHDMSNYARHFVEANFSYTHFKKQVLEVFNPS